MDYEFFEQEDQDTTVDTAEVYCFTMEGSDLYEAYIEL